MEFESFSMKFSDFRGLLGWFKSTLVDFLAVSLDFEADLLVGGLLRGHPSWSGLVAEPPGA